MGCTTNVAGVAGLAGVAGAGEMAGEMAVVAPGTIVAY